MSENAIRAADADREQAVERMRGAAAEGRLEPEELEERIEAALRARTHGELEPLTADLPLPRRCRGSRQQLARFRDHRRAFAVAAPAMVALWRSPEPTTSGRYGPSLA